MPQSTRRWITQKIDELRNAPQLPFHDLLDPATVNQVLDKNQVSFRDRIFSPLVTLWTFLSQVLSLDHSCREAVARLIAFRVSNGQEPCGPETGSYCKARPTGPRSWRSWGGPRHEVTLGGRATQTRPSQRTGVGEGSRIRPSPDFFPSPRPRRHPASAQARPEAHHDVSQRSCPGTVGVRPKLWGSGQNCGGQATSITD